MRRLLAMWLVGALAAMLVLGACGGGSDDDGDADAVDAAADTSESDEDASASDDDDGGSSDDDGDDGGVAAAAAGAFTASRCMEAIQVFSAAVSSASLAMSGDTKGMEAAFKQTEEFIDDAPRDIRDDLEVWSEAYTAYAKGIADSGWNPASGKAPTQEQTDKLEAAGAKLQEPDYLEAQGNIDEWLSSDCGNR